MEDQFNSSIVSEGYSEISKAFNLNFAANAGDRFENMSLRSPSKNNPSLGDVMDEVLEDGKHFAGSTSGISKPSFTSLDKKKLDPVVTGLPPPHVNQSVSYVGEHGCSGTTGGTIAVQQLISNLGSQSTKSKEYH